MRPSNPTLVCDTPTQTVLRDDVRQIEVVLAKDAVIEGNSVYPVPGRASLASWLLDTLQKRALYATRLAYAGKEGVPRRSALSRFEVEIRQRGYMRPPVKALPFRLLLHNAQGDKNQPVTHVTIVDVEGRETTPSLTKEELDAMTRPATQLMVSFRNRYTSIGLRLESALIEMGTTGKGKYQACNFPGLPETAEITSPDGTPYDYRLLREGRTDLFLERYREICRLFGLASAQVPGLDDKE